MHLTPGNVHDVVEAPKLIEVAQGGNFIADKAYDSESVVQALEAKGMNAVIPSKSNKKNPREIDFYLYKERHLVECFFNKLKQYRRAATRYDKTAINFLGFLFVISVRIWLA